MSAELALFLVKVAALGFIACAWLFIVGIGFALVLGVHMVFCHLRDRHTDQLMRRGMRAARSRGWIPEDLQ